LIDNIFLKAINFNNALIFILENNALSKEKLCYLNKIITNKLFKTTRKKQEIGKYRISEVSFGSFKGINAKLIDKKISKIFCEYNKNEFHSKLEIYDMYSKLLLTHPFIDGNGRVMRSIFISEWLKNGYEPFVLTHSDKMKLTEYTNYYLKNHNPQNAIKFLEHLENKYSNFYF
jgi:fido (protein-threonine AMPylation protein)